ncbi:serine/threonine protein kinase [Rhodopirellula europaea]|uniref:Serine/threonine protein kinase n=1 Tax=Rhodopirellula europaea SH398 TaxID=1263868 RepID=M5SNS8_9BACT|nr:serine/threonine-protein kinase [Rhodopirellula europaea]EMI27904.1 serine/threonine protein kinase [Rhodopirellula europaea SH398]
MTNPTERAIFLQAIEEENPEERMAYLDSACGSDAVLRKTIEELLAAHEQPAALLDHPIGADRSLPSFAEPVPVELVEHIGMQIGTYTLREQIGEGGFGLVFVAEQEHPVRRRVALKIVKPGVGSKEVIARFEAERQAVALMNHPNIAQVFDAGVTADYRPYFVMELVRGLPITEFCDEKQMDVRERLNLMIDVCSAVHHAHQKGVIHRDIKPSNVMVTLHDDRAVAKVIDFGVAKALDQKLTDKTVYTRFFSIIGTPLYMSPEQAEMSSLDVDTRSDIYSLGVLMYELLVGATPFDRGRLDSVGLDEMRRIIREEEPPRPSTRLSTLTAERIRSLGLQNGGAGTSQSRSLNSDLRGDLDWIVMKALEKDRTRRYDSAASLADDIRHYLHGEPVTARPPSKFYRFQKFARRNRVAIGTATLVGCTLILGTAASLWQMSAAIRERNAKDEALRDAMVAKTEAIAAKQKVERFAEGLKVANELVASGQTHANSGEWKEAARDFDAAVEIQPSYDLPRVQRAQLFSRLRLWPEAAQDYAIALATGARTSQPQWWGVPALFLYQGYTDEYRQLAEQYQAQLLKEPEQPHWLLIRGLAASDATESSIDRKAISDLAHIWLWQREFGPPPRDDRSRQSSDRRKRDYLGRLPPTEDSPLSVCQYSTGLAELRNGEYKSAAEQFLEAADDHRWPARYIVDSPLAIAYHHQGNSELAQQTLERATENLTQRLEELQRPNQMDHSSPWFDLIEALILHEEACRTITDTPSTLRPQLDQLRQASLKLIKPR